MTEDDTPPPPNGQPTYRILLSASDEEELDDRDIFSDVLLPGTFIASGRRAALEPELKEESVVEEEESDDESIQESKELRYRATRAARSA